MCFGWVLRAGWGWCKTVTQQIRKGLTEGGAISTLNNPDYVDYATQPN